MAKVCVCDGLEIIDGCLGVNIAEDPCSALAMVGGALSVPGIDRFDKDPQLLSTLSFARLTATDQVGSGNTAVDGVAWGEIATAEITNHSACRKMWAIPMVQFLAQMEIDSGRMWLGANRSRNGGAMATFWSSQVYSADAFAKNVHESFTVSFSVLEPGETLTYAIQLEYGRSHNAVNARLTDVSANINLFGILG